MTTRIQIQFVLKILHDLSILKYHSSQILGYLGVTQDFLYPLWSPEVGLIGSQSQGVSYLRLPGKNEGMEKKMETIIMGFTGVI